MKWGNTFNVHLSTGTLYSGLFICICILPIARQHIVHANAMELKQIDPLHSLEKKPNISILTIVPYNLPMCGD